MADFIATTVCQPAKVTDAEAIEAIISKYEFYGLVVGIKEDGFNVYGYDWFDVSSYDEEKNQYDDDKTDDFLAEIQPYIEDKLIIQMIGHEKCRYIGAAQVTVTKDKIIWRTIDGDDFSVLKRLKSYRQKIHEMVGDAEMTKTPAELDAILSQEADIKNLIDVAKAVGAIALLLEFADFLNLDAGEYMPYAALLKV